MYMYLILFKRILRGGSADAAPAAAAGPAAGALRAGGAGGAPAASRLHA